MHRPDKILIVWRCPENPEFTPGPEKTIKKSTLSLGKSPEKIYFDP